MPKKDLVFINIKPLKIFIIHLYFYYVLLVSKVKIETFFFIHFINYKFIFWLKPIYCNKPELRKSAGEVKHTHTHTHT